MKLPRDLSGEALAKLLARHGYVVVRQTGSHLRLVLRSGDREFRVTVPRHATLKPGTLNAILGAVARHLEVDRNRLLSQLFGD